ncbi:MAG: DNA topoisomerase VI subunit B [Candidatus Nanohaloarchaea archaeon]
MKEAVDNSLTYSTPFVYRKDGETVHGKIGSVIDRMIEENRENVETKRGGDLEKLRLKERDVESLSFDTESYDLDFKDVSSVMRHKVNSDIFEVETEGGRKVELTDYHSVFVLRDGEIVSVETSELEENDYIVMPKESWGGSNIRDINIFKELMALPESETEDLGLYEVESLIEEYRSQIEEYVDEKYRLQDFRKCDRLPFNIARRLDLDKSEIRGCKIGFKLGPNNIPAVISAGRDLAELLGIYAAEGSVTGGRERYEKVYFSLGSHEKKLIDHVEALVERVFGLEPSTVDAHESAVNVTVNSKAAGLVMENVFGIENRADEKTLPRFVLDLSSDLRERFFIAYAAGDGYPTEEIIPVLRDGGDISDVAVNKITVSSSSRMLSSGMRYLLSSIGIDSTEERAEPENRTVKGEETEFGESFLVHVRTGDTSYSNRLPAEEVLEKVSSPKLEYNLENRNQQRVGASTVLKMKGEKKVEFKEEGLKIAESDLTAVPIKSIEKIEYNREWVYDVSVPGDENFMAGNHPLACHNSLDACEEDEILPEIHVLIDEIGDDKCRVEIRDNAIGLDRQTIPKVFGKLLYGSKFHKLQQSLLPDQKVLVRKDGDVQLVEIGQLCDELIESEEGDKTAKIDQKIEAPCFKRATGEVAWRDVTHAIRHENRHETFRIETSRDREIEVTGNHSLFGLTKEGEIEEIEASELGEGDSVLSPQKIPNKGEKNSLNILSQFKADEIEEMRWYVYGVSEEKLQVIKKKGEKVRKKPSPESRKRTYYRYKGVDILKDSLEQNYLEKNYLPAEKLLRLGWEDKVENGKLRTYQVGGNEKEIPLKIDLDSEFMRFLGLFAAEGHVDERQAGFTFGSHEQEFVSEVRQTAEDKLQISTTMNKREGNSTRVKIFGSPIVKLMEKLCGRGAQNKHVPNFVFETSECNQKSFLKGLIDGDGSTSHPGNEVSLTSTSKRMAQQVSYLINMLGVVASWKERRNDSNISGGETVTYDVLVHGEDLEVLDFGHDTERKSKYKMLPAELMEDLRVKEVNAMRVRSNKAGLYYAAGLGSKPQFSKKFVEKVEKIKSREEVEEDYYLKELRNRGLVEQKSLTNKMQKIEERVEKLLEFSESDLCLLDVKEIEKTKSPEYVYDISVPGTGKDENFIAGNQGALCVKNSRGQQGIGISASAMYAQLTAGEPVTVYSKMEGEPCHKFVVRIDTEENEPEIIEDEVIESDSEEFPGDKDYYFDHGTTIEMNIEAKYTKGHHSVRNYLKHTAIMNPYARVVLREPDGNKIEYPRVSKELPEKPKEIKPHPHGVELGVMMRMMENTDARTISSYLQQEFTRVGRTSAEEICDEAEIDTGRRPNTMDKDEIEQLLNAAQNVKLQSPPKDCLSPIGEDLVLKGLKKELNPEFSTAITRKPTVYGGNPFQVEVGLAWGGDIEEEGSYDELRYANKVPLLYKKSSCVTTKAIEEVSWNRYNVSQAGERPQGPLYILVHIASVWVPFTSEGKEAVANYDPIRKEMKLALQEAGRKLGRYIGRKERKEIQEKKRRQLTSYAKEMGPAIAELAGEGDPEEIEDKIQEMVENDYNPEQL